MDILFILKVNFLGTRNIGWFLLFLVFLFLPLKDVFATHEADHRYVISGYVRDGAGVAKEDATVHLEHKGGEKKKVNTNGSGYYEILFHLHNDSLGDEILVRVGDVEKKIKITFDPKDTVTSRGDSVNFGAEAKETEIWVYLTLASLLLMAFAFNIYLGQLKKKKKAIARQEKKSRKKK